MSDADFGEDRSRTVIAIGSLAAVPFGGDGAVASGGTLSVSPSSGVAVGATVTVSGTGITTAGGQLFTGAVALLQCGNAASNGTPLATIGKTDCDTSAQLANLVFATVTDGVLPPTSFTTRTSGIGANARTCIPTPPATRPCAIAVGDIATTGATVQTAATYTLVGSASTAPTTTVASATGGTLASTGPTTALVIGQVIAALALAQLGYLAILVLRPSRARRPTR